MSGVKKKVIYLHLHNTKATVACFAIFMPCRQTYSQLQSRHAYPKICFQDNKEIRDNSKFQYNQGQDKQRQKLEASLAIYFNTCLILNQIPNQGHWERNQGHQLPKKSTFRNMSLMVRDSRHACQKDCKSYLLSGHKSNLSTRRANAQTTHIQLCIILTLWTWMKVKVTESCV